MEDAVKKKYESAIAVRANIVQRLSNLRSANESCSEIVIDEHTRRDSKIAVGFCNFYSTYGLKWEVQNHSYFGTLFCGQKRSVKS